MTTATPQGPVAYVLRRFPVLSETFVLNEILALEALGQDVHVFALAQPRDPRFHESLSRLRAPITYVPGPLEIGALLEHHRKLFRRRRKLYLDELGRVLLTLSPRFLWRFLQAGYVADKARSLHVPHFHAHFANRATTVASLASRMLRIPHSFTAHAFDIFQDVEKEVLAKKMQDARFVVTVSDFNVAYLRTVLAGREARIERIYNGIDLEQFRPAHRPAASPFTILAVARLVEKKGLRVLVDACAHLRGRGVAVRCWIVGKGAERPLLVERIRELGLEAHVELLGALTQGEVLARYHQAHVLVLPCIVASDGNADGLPVSIVEALACGLPVVSTPVTGVPEAVVHGTNGLLVPSGDVVALADAVQSLAADPALRDRLARAARASVEQKFDQRDTARRLVALLQGTS